MTRHLFLVFGLTLFSAAAIPSRAGAQPPPGIESQKKKVWTNADLDKLHDLGLISIVGQVDDQVDEESSTSESAPAEYDPTQDPEWYAEQAAWLQDELEYRQDQLRQYRQALDDARNLRDATSGADFVDGDFGITPEDGIEILEQRVTETQERLDALEDLARRNDIEPGTLRGQ
jgi:hypothetical protein